MAERSTSSYLVLDTMPIVGIAQKQQQYNRKLNAEKAARSATGAAKIQESFNNLNTKSFERDNEYIKNMINETESWMVDTYSKYGETAIYDKPELKKEFNTRLNNIEQFAQMSRNQMAMANEQLKKRSENPDELDYESVLKFDKWLELPSEQRVFEPVPMISQRQLNLSEAINKYGKPHMEGLLMPFKTPGKIDEDTGEYMVYEGNRYNKEKLNNLVQDYNNNPTSEIFRSADREAKEDFDYERTSETILDDQGNEIPNPNFKTELSKERAKRIQDEILRQAGTEYTKTTRRYTPGAAKKAESKTEVIETPPEEAQYTTESIPEQFSKDVRYSITAKDETGKIYYKLKTPSYSYKGKVYANKEELPKGVTSEDAIEIPIGSFIDAEGNVKPDDSGLTETKDIKSYKAQREFNVPNPGESKTLSVDSYYTPDGKEVSVREGTALEGQMIKHIDVKAVEKDGQLYFEGKEYKEGNPKRIGITMIKTKDGNIVSVPTTNTVRNTFPDEYKQIDSKSGVNYKTKKTEKSSGISWSKK